MYYYLVLQMTYMIAAVNVYVNNLMLTKHILMFIFNITISVNILYLSIYCVCNIYVS